jgi:hypothetical protein
MKCSYFFLTLITYFSNINYIFFSPVANSAMKKMHAAYSWSKKQGSILVAFH